MNLSFLLVQPIGNICKSASFVPRSLLVLVLLTGLGSLTKVEADGMFVAPKFVWDKHKDINEPTQKAIIVYDAGREDLILQVKYEGPVSEFGWLVPVPNLPTVQKGSMKCFYELSQYTQRHFETAWQHNQTKSMSLGVAGIDSAGKSEPPVKVIEIKTVGAYEIAVLATKDTGALEKWLEANHFSFPTNATAVIDSYVQRQWYFVAAKVNLEQGALGLVSSALKLPAGELNPLQISFASEHCVYPLKISSANGTPSEIQVYVLSPEPLLEKTMLEKKLPLIYSNDMAQARLLRRSAEYMLLQEKTRDIELRGEAGTVVPALSAEDKRMIQKRSETPVATPDNLLPYARVTKTNLPDCSQAISRLADKSWWLTKQTWTFRPEEMRDLLFEPAISALADELGTKYGYYTADKLARFGAEAVPAFIAALQSTNSIARINAASVFNWRETSIRDSRLTEAAVTWLNDSEPEVRMAGVNVMTQYGSWNPKFAEPLVAMLRDKDANVRYVVASCLIRFDGDVKAYIPVFREMLKDKDPNIQYMGLQMLLGLRSPVPVEDLLPLFKIHHDWSHRFPFGLIDQVVYHEDISNEEAIPLLQSPEPSARIIGLWILYKNKDKQSVELALPLLKDPLEPVRAKAAKTLRALTGQHFTEDQPDQWEKWWAENKTNFVVQLHPEELRPARFRTNSLLWLMTNRPPVRVP
jgi:HEAT repeat protein